MKIELCVASAEAARIAAELNVDRMETCAALEVGGLTPTTAMVDWITNTFDVPQHVLIRPRAGGFCYSYDELLIMRNDILEFGKRGVAGIVVGALTKSGQLDINALETFHRAAGSMELTFHRAFEDIVDWKTAMDQLIKLGFTRILSSGQAASVSEGMERLREMCSYAAGRIEIMAGGGVHAENIKDVSQTGVDAIHFSGTKMIRVDSESLFAADLALPDKSKLERMINLLQ